MPSLRINLSKPQVDDLTALCGLGATQLNRLVDAFENVGPTIRRSELRRAIRDVAASEDVADAVYRVLSGLALARRLRRTPVPDLLGAIANTLPERGWNGDKLRIWHECAPIVGRLIESPPIVLSTKARDLSEDFERVLSNTRVLTDMRPIYDDADAIVGIEITQTLRIDYVSPSDNSPKTISFVLDHKDIEKLQEDCARALIKANSAKNTLQSQFSNAILMPGEEG
jgi:hypothetical protein